LLRHSEEQREPIRQNINNNEGMRQATLEGGYEPAQYANLPVSGELKELFKTIQRYILNHSDTPHKYNNSIQNLRPSFPSLFQP